MTIQRNLLFYCYPLASGGVQWRRAVGLLRQHIDQFNGPRIICLSLGPGTENPEDVRREFDGMGITHWLERENDPKLGEAAHFLEMAGIAMQEPGITWYGHAKGVTRPVDHGPVKQWVEACFDAALAAPGVISEHLREATFTGPFRRTMLHRRWRKLGSRSGWHFSGTFFWWHNERVQQKNWNRIELHKYGVEAWPALVANRDESRCIFGDDAADLYLESTWNDGMSDRVRQWRELCLTSLS